MNYPALVGALTSQIIELNKELDACQRELVRAKVPTIDCICPVCHHDGWHSCEFCHPEPSASTATGMAATPSFKAFTPDAAPAADTRSQRTGTPGVPDEYIEILTDVADLLNGIDNDATPLVRMAAMAIEYELSERMLDALGNG